MKFDVYRLTTIPVKVHRTENRLHRKEKIMITTPKQAQECKDIGQNRCMYENEMITQQDEDEEECQIKMSKPKDMNSTKAQAQLGERI